MGLAAIQDMYPSSPSLCVVICIHNAPDYSELCIESVLKHTELPYDLVLVDDGSGADTSLMVQRYVRDYPHIRMIRHDKAKGYTGAANAGLRASNADYTVLLNSDTLASPRWAEKLMACAEGDASIGIVGPLSNAATYQSIPFVFEDNGTWKQNHLPGDITVAEYSNSVEQFSLKMYPRVPVVSGFCFCIKRALIDTIGYLDEETFPQGYGEENDYCLRAADAGYTIAVADDTYIYHATSQSFGVETREKLTYQAHHAIRSKYSQERLDGIDAAQRGHKEMQRVREHFARRVHHSVHADTNTREALLALPQSNQAKSFLFLLPGCSAKAGGSQVIVETARGLADLGVPVKIALKYSTREEYELLFPGDTPLFFYYRDDRELLERAKRYDVAIATIFHSVRQLAAIKKAHPHITPAYYVQDYEPWFLNDDPGMKTLAEQSYTMIKDCRLFAISPWVQDVIQEKHQVGVEKIQGMVDLQLFHPNYARQPRDTVVITAMIRPSTPWRGAARTLELLHALKEKYQHGIDIRLFGCSDHALDQYRESWPFAHINYGALSRHEVASLLRDSDVFLDLSDFQAFGRTALEAMACGCAVIAPEKGGVHDYGRHDENLLLVNTEQMDACRTAADSLIDDPVLRQRLGETGINTALRYSIHEASLSFLKMMY